MRTGTCCGVPDLVRLLSRLPRTVCTERERVCGGVAEVGRRASVFVFCGALDRGNARRKAEAPAIWGAGMGWITRGKKRRAGLSGAPVHFSVPRLFFFVKRLGPARTACSKTTTRWRPVSMSITRSKICRCLWGIIVAERAHPEGGQSEQSVMSRSATADE